MRNRWTTWLATSALVLLVGSGITAIRADAADAAKKDFPFPHHRRFSGWEIVTLPSAVVPNFTVRQVQCPSGKKVLGGGGNASGVNPILLGSFPSSDGSAWNASGRSSTAADVAIAVWAVCAKVS